LRTGTTNQLALALPAAPGLPCGHAEKSAVPLVPAQDPDGGPVPVPD